MDLEILREQIATALYEHWRSHDYELNRQPEFATAPDNLRQVFLRQADAVLPVMAGDAS